MRNKDHPLYMTWKMMRQRCNNPNFPKYQLYGARGVKICPEWGDFKQFIADVGDRPAPGYTIDRVDTYGNYEPGNVRWADPVQQAANRRPRKDHRMMTVRDETRTQAEWSRRLKIGQTTINRRRELGWSDEKILTTPVDKRFNKMKVR